MSKVEIKTIGVMTSGGDSPGMNAAIRAVSRACASLGIKCKGIRMGYKGLIEDDVIDLGPRDVSNIINRGGTILKTARCLEFKTPEGRAIAYKNFKKHGMDALVVIGGDGSFTGAMLLHKEHGVPVVGVPGTIDNDIFGTDFTVGYDTALNTVVSAIDKIRDTAQSHDRMFFIEVMGRDAGFIALNTGIATGATDILIPESKDSIDDLFTAIDHADKNGRKSNIIVVSEGEKMAGIYDIANFVKIKYPTYDVRVTILGHIQRGGDPSCADRVLASRLGVAAVEALLDGKTNVMAGIRGHKVVYTQFDEAIKKHNEIDKDLVKVADLLAI